ncbi:MAG: hypothetical protein U0869_04690 [Chloroflexota bacterium]
MSRIRGEPVELGRGHAEGEVEVTSTSIWAMASEVREELEDDPVTLGAPLK